MSKKLLAAAAGVAAVALPVALGLLSASRSQAQSAAAHPEFEVASIRLNTSCGNGGAQNPSPGRLSVGCIPLQYLIQVAYGSFANGPVFGPKRLQILGGPGWIASDRYDLAAKAEGNPPLQQVAGPMLQALLEDRFKLKLHRETRESPVYALTVAKNGLKLPPLKEGSCVPLDVDGLLRPPAPGQPGSNFCGGQTIGSNGQGLTLDAHGMSIADFADRLSNSLLDRTVIDKTGIAGLFDFHLEFRREETPSGPGNGGGPATLSDSIMPSIFAGVQEQLGLKLSPDKGPVEVLVIDHVEKPSAN